MVDIFEIAPVKDAQSQRSAPTTPYALVGHEARQMRYRSLLSKLSAEDVTTAAVAPEASRVDWQGNGVGAEDIDDEDDDDEDEYLQYAVPHIRTEPSHDALVGTFREAAAAMA